MPTGYLSEVFVSFQGEGLEAGRRQLFVRLGGCPLRCRYCDTPGSLERSPAFLIRRPEGAEEAANPVAAEDLVREHLAPLLARVRPVDGTAITGGEPLVQVAFLQALLPHPALPRPRLLETAGTLPRAVAAVVDQVEVVSMDMKLPSNSGEGPFWDQHARFLEACRGKAYVKILVDDGTDPAEIEQAARVVRAVAPQTPVVLQPITDPAGRPAADPRRLEAAYERVRRHLREVRVLPQMHRLLGVP